MIVMKLKISSKWVCFSFFNSGLLLNLLDLVNSAVSKYENAKTLELPTSVLSKPTTTIAISLPPREEKSKGPINLIDFDSTAPPSGLNNNNDKNNSLNNSSNNVPPAPINLMDDLAGLNFSCAPVSNNFNNNGIPQQWNVSNTHPNIFNNDSSPLIKSPPNDPNIRISPTKGNYGNPINPYNGGNNDRKNNNHNTFDTSLL